MGTRARCNPDLLEDELEASQEVARGFHGRDNQGEIEEAEEELYRSELALLGELVELEIYNEHQRRLVPFKFTRKSEAKTVQMACSSDRKQLFLVGGDQELLNDTLEALSPIGWDKDKVPCGYVYSISYFADKHHLTGPKQQKFGTEYIHEFGEQTGPKWKPIDKVAAGLLPLVVYDRLNCRLELVGGNYEIRDEGIYD